MKQKDQFSKNTYELSGHVTQACEKVSFNKYGFINVFTITVLSIVVVDKYLSVKWFLQIHYLYQVQSSFKSAISYCAQNIFSSTSFRDKVKNVFG